MNVSHQKALRPMALVAALLAAPALSACGVNFGAQTDQIYTPADGENSREGAVDVLNALIVSQEPGSGRLIAGLSNHLADEDDALVDVEGAGEDEGITVSMEEVELPANTLVQLADTEEPILVTGEEDEVQAGTFVRLTFTFENSDAVELNVPVLAPGEDYTDVEIPDASNEPGGADPSATPSGPDTSPSSDPTETPEG